METLMETTNNNIDNDNTIPSMCPMDVAEQLQVMRHQEENTYACTDFFATLCHHHQQHEAIQRMTADSRSKMCNWCFQIVDFCKIYQHETVEIAMSLFDRFLSTPEGHFALHNQRQFQLAAVTTLYMAIKLFEHVQMETTLLAQLSHGEYCATEISDMEQIILTALQWRMNGPTRMAFALYFLALLPAQVRENSIASEALVSLTRLQVDLATADYYFTTRRLSTAAMAAVLNAVEAVGLEGNLLEMFFQSLVQYSGVDPLSCEVQEARTRLLSQAGSSAIPSIPTVQSMLQGARHANVAGVDIEKNVAFKDAGASSPVCVSRTAEAQHYSQ